MLNNCPVVVVVVDVGWGCLWLFPVVSAAIFFPIRSRELIQLGRTQRRTLCAAHIVAVPFQFALDLWSWRSSFMNSVLLFLGFTVSCACLENARYRWHGREC